LNAAHVDTAAPACEVQARTDKGAEPGLPRHVATGQELTVRHDGDTSIERAA